MGFRKFLRKLLDCSSKHNLSHEDNLPPCRPVRVPTSFNGMLEQANTGKKNTADIETMASIQPMQFNGNNEKRVAMPKSPQKVAQRTIGGYQVDRSVRDNFQVKALDTNNNELVTSNPRGPSSKYSRSSSGRTISATSRMVSAGQMSVLSHRSDFIRPTADEIIADHEKFRRDWHTKHRTQGKKSLSSSR